MTTRIENATVWTGQRLPDGGVFTTDAVAFDGDAIVALGDAARAAGTWTLGAVGTLALAWIAYELLRGRRR